MRKPHFDLRVESNEEPKVTERTGTGLSKGPVRQRVIPAVLTSPGFIVLAVGAFVPIGMLLLLSFRLRLTGTGLITSQLTAANYLRFFRDSYYLGVLWDTFKIAFWSTAVAFALGYPIALTMARGSRRVKAILLVVVLTPLMTNMIARTLGLMILLSKTGPVVKLLGLFGFPEQTIYGVPAIVIGLTQVYMPYMILTISSVLQNIDLSLESAARDLGGSRMTSFWKVTFPLSMPGVVAGSLFVFLRSFNGFVTPVLLGRGRVMVMTMLMQQQAMLIVNWPFAAAIATLVLALTLVLVAVYSRALRTSRESVGHRTHRINVWVKLKERLYDGTTALSVRIHSMGGRIQIPSLVTQIGSVSARVGMQLYKSVGLILIIAPLPMLIASSFTTRGQLTFPLSGGFTTRWYASLSEYPEYIRAALLSLELAGVSVVIALTVGTMAALALTRYKFRGREVLRSLFLSPLMLPAVIVGLSLLRFMVMMGWAGTWQAVLIGHLFLTIPFVVRTVAANLIGFDRSLEEAARDLGASAFTTFRRITLPLIKPGLIIAGIFAFIVSFDETVISVFTTGAATTTFPVRIFSTLENVGIHPSVTAFSSAQAIVTLVGIAIIARIVGLEKIRMT